MSIQYINTGSGVNSNNGDSLRTAFNKVNANFAYLNSYLTNVSITGGGASTVYLPTDSIDAGLASSIYAVSDVIDGGLAKG